MAAGPASWHFCVLPNVPKLSPETGSTHIRGQFQAGERRAPDGNNLGLSSGYGSTGQIALSSMVLTIGPPALDAGSLNLRRAIDWHETRMHELSVPERVTCREKVTAMQTAIASNQVGKFPVIQFRKKRLTVAIHTHFDMQSAEDVNEVKRLVEQALAQLAEDGDVKVSYALSDV
jgi:hypothetical protein